MVAVGVTLVEPLADEDVNVPGVMATLAAPVVTQLRVLLAPELTPLGFAAKEVIAGATFFSEGEGDDPQPVSAAMASRRKTKFPLPS